MNCSTHSMQFGLKCLLNLTHFLLHLVLSYLNFASHYSFYLIGVPSEDNALNKVAK